MRGVDVVLLVQTAQTAAQCASAPLPVPLATRAASDSDGVFHAFAAETVPRLTAAVDRRRQVMSQRLMAQAGSSGR